MKKITTASFLILMIAALSSCTQSSSTNKKSSSSSSSSSSSGSSSGSGTGSTTGCSDGVYRDGATSCYYTNLPKMVFHGKGTYGTTLWSSKTNVPSYISQSQFSTDSAFAVRIKPSVAIAGEAGLPNSRTCSTWTLNNFTKMKVWVMLRKSTSSLGEVKELTATVGSYSNTARFTVPSGSTAPFILEVIGINTDHRCKTSVYGKLDATNTAACTAGTAYFDIPLNTTTASNPTECVAMNLEFATDDTYDLPN